MWGTILGTAVIASCEMTNSYQLCCPSFTNHLVMMSIWLCSVYEKSVNSNCKTCHLIRETYCNECDCILSWCTLVSSLLFLCSQIKIRIFQVCADVKPRSLDNEKSPLVQNKYCSASSAFTALTFSSILRLAGNWWWWLYLGDLAKAQLNRGLIKILICF